MRARCNDHRLPLPFAFKDSGCMPHTPKALWSCVAESDGCFFDVPKRNRSQRKPANQSTCSLARWLARLLALPRLRSIVFVLPCSLACVLTGLPPCLPQPNGDTTDANKNSQWSRVAATRDRLLFFKEAAARHMLTRTLNGRASQRRATASFGFKEAAARHILTRTLNGRASLRRATASFGFKEAAARHRYITMNTIREL